MSNRDGRFVLDALEDGECRGGKNGCNAKKKTVEGAS